MKIRVSFGESVEYVIGKSHLEVDFEGGTLEHLLKKLGEADSKIREEILSEKDVPCTFSINDEIVLDLNRNLNEGDEVYVFLPVAGG